MAVALILVLAMLLVSCARLVSDAPAPEGSSPGAEQCAARSDGAPEPYGATPSARHLLWHEREFYGFLHFGVNTFTDRQWGLGSESPSDFNPTEFDADQIAGAAARVGMTGLIVTAKHHDGFCLWPSAYTEHSVKSSVWKEGKGDVLRELSDACRRHGLFFGVYLSPWDRNHADYARPEYITCYRNQLREVLTNYGPISEVWFDGANGGDGYYGGANERRTIDARTYYDWENTRSIVRELAPTAVMFSDGGPDVRWVGNESGYAGETCWATINRDGFLPGVLPGGGSGLADLNAGHRNGTHWVPAEVDVSIRPGWFYTSSQDDKVKTPEQLVDIYYKSVGRGANLLLNVPPDRRGIWHERDVAALEGMRRILDATFETDLAQGAKATASNTRLGGAGFAPANVLDGNAETYWATDDDVRNPELVLDLAGPTTFDVVRIREYLPLGQRIGEFALDRWQDGQWVEFHVGTSVGNTRLVRTERIATSRIRLRITQSPVCPAVADVALFARPDR